MAAGADSSGEVNTASDGGRERTDAVESPVKPGSEDTAVAELHGKGEGAHPQGALPPKAGPGEFDLLKVIGMGAFGKVLQVRWGKVSASVSTTAVSVLLSLV